MPNSALPKVSILVPCFNVEPFVVQCLQSLITQTLSNIEVICLNDGSTDKTPLLIRETVGNDPRFRIIDKPNSGYGSTMNLGLQMARGEYIGIVESDDYVEPTMFEKLYNAAIEHNLDIARCCFNTLRNGQVKANRCKFLPKNIVFDPEIKDDAFRHPPWECLDFCVQGGFQGGSQSRLSFVYRGLKINDQRLRGALSRRHKCAKRGECGASSATRRIPSYLASFHRVCKALTEQ